MSHDLKSGLACVYWAHWPAYVCENTSPNYCFPTAHFFRFFYFLYVKKGIFSWKEIKKNLMPAGSKIIYCQSPGRAALENRSTVK